MGTQSGIGVKVLRSEDRRFLTGRGTYTDDIVRPGQVYAQFVRSPVAHAVIRRIDASQAEACPGVLAVFSGADMAADGVGGLPCGWQVIGKKQTPMNEPAHPALAVGKVRYVGDPVAVVIAETRDQARDAAERLVIDYDETPAAPTLAAALDPNGAQIHDEAPGNLCFDWELGDAEAVKTAFQKAEHVSRLELVNNRLVPNAMEPRACIGEYDAGQDQYTLYTTSQNPHVIRLLMGAFVLHLPESKLRVVAPDVGGGFGSKIFHYNEEAVVTWAAGKLKRPVKWTAERTESFQSDAHGRDHVTTVELATDRQGRFLGLRVRTKANLGAYLSTFAPSIPTYLYATLLAGLYKTPAIHAEVKGVFTNSAPVDAYRGAGRPECCYLLERIVENCAYELGLDPAEIRRRNFIKAEDMPYQTPVALQYDSGDFQKNMEDAIALHDVEGFERRRAESEAKGFLRGIGYSTYIEACGIAPSNIAGALGARAGLYEAATLRVDPTGTVTVLTGSHSHGQGHETTFAQVVAHRLGIPFESVRVVHGDTARIPFGMGTYGSRSLAVGGSALSRALDKIVDKSRKIAAHLLEASETDVDFRNGAFRVTGTDRKVTFGEVAMAAYVPHNYPLDVLEPGLEETAFYDPKNFTFPNGCHLCEVEIDPETGRTRIDRYTVVDDFGKVVNPMIVEGQVHGGIVQGIGQALLENCVYDPETGQLVTGSYMDYCMPRADDAPPIRLATNEVPCTHNPLGVKGCGEAGTIGAPAAVMNAVVHALRPHGITHLDMPATPQRVWRALAEGGRHKAA